VACYWVDTCTFKKIKKNQQKKNIQKPRSDTLQSLFIAVNDLNDVSKKGLN